MKLVIVHCTDNEITFQLGPKKKAPVHVIQDKWQDLSLPKEQFDELVRIGGFAGEVEWLRFFALACSSLGEVNRFILTLTEKI